MELITLALPKGRLLKGALALAEAAGYPCRGLAEGRLFEEDPALGTRYLLLRPADVPTYVEHGAADLGVVGKDTLMEHEGDVVELLDLKYGLCRFVVAGPRDDGACGGAPGGCAAGGCAPGIGAPNGVGPGGGGRGGGGRAGGDGPVRVATKFPRVAAGHFRSRGVPAEIITVRGSTEIAPLAGLAACIVDLVSTGRTLRENGLEVLEEIAPVTARLIANPVSYRLKAAGISPFLEAVREAVGRAEAAT